MVDKTDISLINKAISEAWKYQILTYPNPAVGAVIADKYGSIVATGVHKKAGFPHAEVEAVKNAYFKLTNDHAILNIQDSHKIHGYILEKHLDIFKDFTIYVTLEPCNHHGKTPPCSRLIKELGFKRVVIGMIDPNSEASGGAEYLRSCGIDVDILENSRECEDLLLPFVKWRRKNFVFFKLAMSTNGVIGGGIITEKVSRELVHMYRDKIDLLVIGGNTVRIDRPVLDSRMAQGRAPDVMIYSKRRDFDESIPLFGIENRKVYIRDDLELLKEYKCIMIEGGEGMLEATRDIVDLYAIFRSPNFNMGENINMCLDLKEVNSTLIENDRLSWYKKI